MYHFFRNYNSKKKNYQKLKNVYDIYTNYAGKLIRAQI